MCRRSRNVVRRSCAAACALLLLTLGAPAVANPPSPTFSVLPAAIDVVGWDGTVADPLGGFLVQVRDANNAPVPGAIVSVDFAAATGIGLSTEQHFPGVAFTNCTLAQVQATADLTNGIAEFRIMGGVGVPDGPCTVSIYATEPGGSPVLLGTRPASAFDRNAINGIDADDVHLWLCDFAPGTNPCVSDYVHDDMVVASDLSRLLSTVFARRSTQSGPICGSAGGPTAATYQTGLQLTQLNCSNPPTTSYSGDYCQATKHTDYACSVTLPTGVNVNGLTGAEVIVDVLGTPGEPIPGMWQFAPGCRSNPGRVVAIQANAPQQDFDGTFLYDCMNGSDAWAPHVAAPNEGGTIGDADSRWLGPGVDQDKSRIQVLAAAGLAQTPLACAYGAVNAGQQTVVVAFSVRHSGAACATSTCAAGVTLVLKEVRLLSRTPTDCAIGCAAHSRAEQTTTVQPSLVILHPDASGSNVVLVNGGASGLVLDVPGEPVARAWLGEPTPNPVRLSTSLSFRLTHAGHARLAVFDISGRRIATLVDGTYEAGLHSIAWDGRDRAGRLVPSGAFFTRLETDGVTLARALIVSR